MDEQDTEIEFEDLENVGDLETEIGSPIVVHKDGLSQMVIWPSPTSKLPEEIFEHEFLAVEPVPTEGWVPAANYDWVSEKKTLVKRSESEDDGEG